MSDPDSCDHDWREEAYAVIRDIEQHVRKISISKLSTSRQNIYFNMTTLDDKDYCVELTAGGFRAVGEKYDSDDMEGKYSTYETPYSLLDNLSPAYRNSFKNELLKKLRFLQKEQDEPKEKEEKDQEEEKEKDENTDVVTVNDVEKIKKNETEAEAVKKER